MFAGVLLGFVLRSRPFRYIQQLITFLIWALLFMLGIEVGGNRAVVESLPELGLTSAAIALAAILGSILFSWGLWRLLNRGARGSASDISGDDASGDASSGTLHAPENSSSGKSPLTGSIIIISFFILGALCGYFRLFSGLFSFSGNLSIYPLCCLLFSVGFSIGNDSGTLRSFMHIKPGLLLLPLMTIIGSLLGCCVLGLFIKKYSLANLLAVGSGFGYYSLSSIFIAKFKGAELGTIALISNILREISTLLFSPLLARRFGKLAPISVGGATTMDTTLPIIIRSSGSDMTVISIFHGFVMDFAVPLLVTLFCSMS